MKGSSRRNFFDAHLSRARELSRKAAEEKVKRGGSAKGARDAEERAGLLSYVRRSIVGADEAFEGSVCAVSTSPRDLAPSPCVF